MPSEYSTWPFTPGNSAGVEAGTWDRSVGNVTGRWPLGSTWPNRTAARAVPLLSPGYHASTTEATWLSHGMTTGAPASMTTTVCGLAAATAEISSFCADGRFRLARSAASVSVSSDTTTTAVLAALAAATAWAIPGARSDGVAQLRLAVEPPVSCSVYVWPATRFTPTEYVCTGGVPGSARISWPSRDRLATVYGLVVVNAS